MQTKLEPELERQIRKAGSVRRVARLRQLRIELRKVVAAHVSDLAAATASEHAQLAKSEAAWQLSAIRRATKLDVEWFAPSASVLKASVHSTIQNGYTLREHFSGLSVTASRRIQQQVNIGVAFGESVDDIVRRVRGSYATTRANAETIVRTSVNAVSTRARELVFFENDSAVKTVQLVAVLDSRTSVICMNYDGKRFPVGQGPRPPFHPNCRTTVVPVLDSWKSLGLKDPPAATRASMNGEVADSVTYPKWLKAQPKSVQDEALGKTRAELFRTGKFTVDKFVSDGRILTLKELKR